MHEANPTGAMIMERTELGQVFGTYGPMTSLAEGTDFEVQVGADFWLRATVIPATELGRPR